uniref:ATP-dependent Clp protease proteolytic subunit n=1 Tax=Grammatotheca bergiana TaxID=105189 RepID=A0A291F5L9_9ASTR|nr:ATP-dependent protease proteolytic subunit [Grammatotheca bergiana]ATG27418.1 ATP-dependent protease proteolytic subunit [Grammatotheca bergiana]
MPIGVPQIPYHIPGDEESSWIDLYNGLYRERALFLFQDLNDDMTSQVVGLMIFLTLEDGDLDQFLLINSPGGSVYNGMAIHNTIVLVDPDINTVGMGMAASMAAFILAAGTQTKRIAFPNARVMIHQPRAKHFAGYMDEVLVDADEVLRIRNEITQFFASRAQKPFWMVHEDMERDVFMTPSEAKAYGIVDAVGIVDPAKFENNENENTNNN